MATRQEQTIEVSVSIKDSFADELMTEYPGALRLSDAMRMAAEESVRRRKERLTRDDIYTAIVDALGQSSR